MKRLIGPFCVMITACNPQPSGEAVTRIDLDNPAKASAAPSPTPTPTTASACATVTFEDATFTDCVADPARHRITTVLGNPPHRGFAALAAARPMPEERRVGKDV